MTLFISSKRRAWYEVIRQIFLKISRLNYFGNFFYLIKLMVKYSHFWDFRADPMCNLLTIHSLFKIQCERNFKIRLHWYSFHKLRNVKFVAKSSVLLRIYQDAVNICHHYLLWFSLGDITNFNRDLLIKTTIKAEYRFLLSPKRALESFR